MGIVHFTTKINKKPLNSLRRVSSRGIFLIENKTCRYRQNSDSANNNDNFCLYAFTS